MRVGEAIARRAEANPKPDDVAKLALALETGSLDLAFIYISDAEQRHLRFRRLDPRISPPATYALTIPKNAEHPAMAAALAHLIGSPQGQAALSAAHLTPMDTPEVSGAAPATVR